MQDTVSLEVPCDYRHPPFAFGLSPSKKEKKNLMLSREVNPHCSHQVLLLYHEGMLLRPFPTESSYTKCLFHFRFRSNTLESGGHSLVLP